MGKTRLEAFSDGVLAIVITIMVLEIKAPHGADWPTFFALWPKFVSYVLSFVYVGIYWNNHHHMLHTISRVNGSVLWANLHLLFWLSLMPFSTGWMGENHFERVPTIVYGINLLACAVAYFILQAAIIRVEGHDSPLANAIGKDIKGKLSLLIYAIGIGASLWGAVYLGFACYAVVALIWFVPDQRIEKTIAH